MREREHGEERLCNERSTHVTHTPRRFKLSKLFLLSCSATAVQRVEEATALLRSDTLAQFGNVRKGKTLLIDGL